MNSSLERVVEHGAASIQIPQSTIRVMEMTQNPETPIEALADVIQTDAALGARVLSVANSPAYASQRNITDITGAVMWMGFREIARIAIAVGTLSEISRLQTHMIKMSDFHRHSVQAACLSERLAQKYRCGQDTGFTGGLLHDIGLLVLFSVCESQMAHVLERSLFDDSHPLHFYERETLGFDHAQVGGALARRWGLPEPIVQAIRHHHDFQCDETHRQGVAIVAYANYLLTSLDGAAENTWPEDDEAGNAGVLATLGIAEPGEPELIEQALADAERLVDSSDAQETQSGKPAVATA